MKRSTISSAEQVAGITDTLWEILLRLPPKPLLRFKCVSKRWLSLISDPQFRHLHTLRHLLNNPPNSLLLSYPSRNIVIPLTATPGAYSPDLGFLNPPDVSVVSSRNGLLLCRADPTTYFVCNPATKEFVCLTPHRLPPFVDHQTRAVYLAFDPSRSPHFQVVLTRVIGTPGIPDSFGCHCAVYSSETNSWSDPASYSSFPRKVIPSSSGVYFNGAVHRCNNGGSSVYLDVETRRLESFPMPLRDGEWSKRRVEYFGESGGRLHLMLGDTEQKLKFDVFELKEDYSLWSLKHRVDLNFARAEFPRLNWGMGSTRIVLPFYIVCRGKEGGSMLVLLACGLAISYDPVHCTLRKLGDFMADMPRVEAMYSYKPRGAFQYFESLFSPFAV